MLLAEEDENKDDIPSNGTIESKKSFLVCLPLFFSFYVGCMKTHRKF
jgi:hypothetical protein